jgi:hypothetical protein
MSTIFSIEAGVIPSVRRTSSSRSRSVAAGRSSSSARKIPRRASASGRSMRMCRSKRPGRTTAGSRCSTEFVAATTSSRLSSRLPSSAVSSPFTVRRDSWSGVESRRWATESNSSKNSRHGRFCSAVSNALSMLRAEPPCIELMRSPVETWMKLMPYWPAIACAKYVLPTPGGPCRRIPFHSMP